MIVEQGSIESTPVGPHTIARPPGTARFPPPDRAAASQSKGQPHKQAGNPYVTMENT
jgi:hypothetical protein